MAPEKSWAETAGSDRRDAGPMEVEREEGAAPPFGRCADVGLNVEVLQKAEKIGRRRMIRVPANAFGVRRGNRRQCGVFRQGDPGACVKPLFGIARGNGEARRLRIDQGLFTSGALDSLSVAVVVSSRAAATGGLLLGMGFVLRDRRAARTFAAGGAGEKAQAVKFDAPVRADAMQMRSAGDQRHERRQPNAGQR